MPAFKAKRKTRRKGKGKGKRKERAGKGNGKGKGKGKENRPARLLHLPSTTPSFTRQIQGYPDKQLILTHINFSGYPESIKWRSPRPWCKLTSSPMYRLDLSPSTPRLISRTATTIPPLEAHSKEEKYWQMMKEKQISLSNYVLAI